MTITSGARQSISQLIYVPAIVTLAITILRLVGELAHWSKTWFNLEQGGPWSIVGIVWLVPIFGVYFALRLAGAGEGPPRVGHAIGHALLGALVFVFGFYLFQAKIQNMTGVIVMWTLAAVGAALQFPTWKALFKVMLAYGYAARISVAIVMFMATWGGWQSHYTAPVPPGDSRLVAWVLFGFMPQPVWWVSFTIVVGSLFGTVAVALLPRGSQAADTV
jgi:hypothetical protein